MKYIETCWRGIPCLSIYFQFATFSSEFHPLWSAQPVMIQNGRCARMLHCFSCVRWPGCSSSIQFKFYAAMQLPMSVMGFHYGSAVKTLPAMQETQVWSLSWKDPLEEGMAIHSNILAWEIPWTEEPDRLQSTGSQRAGHDLVTKPLPQSLLLRVQRQSWIE